jgi:hypothetical protein
MAYGAEDIKEQQARAEYLERLYFADLRDLEEHPFHGTLPPRFRGAPVPRHLHRLISAV